jgi:basic amino acid/polyamine antiporter, APA family
MTVLASIFVYLLVAGGVLVLKVIRPDVPRRFRVHWSLPAFAILLLLFIAFVGIQDVLVHLALWFWVGLGLIVYGFYSHARVVRAERAAKRATRVNP